MTRPRVSLSRWAKETLAGHTLGELEADAIAQYPAFADVFYPHHAGKAIYITRIGGLDLRTAI